MQQIGHEPSPAGLRCEQVGLVEHEMQRPAVLAQDRLREGGEKASSVGDAHHLRVEDRRGGAGAEHLRDPLPAAGIERQIGVAAAEDHQRKG